MPPGCRRICTLLHRAYDCWTRDGLCLTFICVGVGHSELHQGTVDKVEPTRRYRACRSFPARPRIGEVSRGGGKRSPTIQNAALLTATAARVEHTHTAGRDESGELHWNVLVALDSSRLRRPSHFLQAPRVPRGKLCLSVRARRAILCRSLL